MMRKKILLVTVMCTVLGVFLNNGLKAQDPLFTQFYANPLYLNPAFAGSHRCPRIIMNHRNQWPAIQGTYVTNSFSYDQHISAIAGGLGVLVTRDDAGAGTLTSTTASLIYSYFLPVTKSFSIKAGMQVSYFQKVLDWSKLTFGDQIDQQLGFIKVTGEDRKGQQNVQYLDFSAGILGYSKSFYIGAAAHHLTKPNEGFIAPGASLLPMKITAHAGAIIATGGSRGRTGHRRRRRNKNALPESSISPNVLYRKQRDFQELFLGLYVTKGPIVGGLWYRNADAFIALIGLQFQNFRFGYSYDVTISKLAANSAGSHEVSAAILFDCRPPRKKFTPVSCPSF
ncbi:MAG: type IX secretion system PorP/SprF family membrane protein [Saprospiraceae bacterium]|jgi:type IX secretion system PorP/SprF family membrane protein